MYFQIFYDKYGIEKAKWTRHGTEFDRDNLKKVFEEDLNFEVEVYNNKTRQEVLDILYKSEKSLSTI